MPTRTALLFPLCATLVLGCAPSDAALLMDAERAAIHAGVDSATLAFHAAERARDPERTIAHFAPELTMLLDGARVGYDSVVASIRRSMPTIVHFGSEWTELEIRVLGPDVAVASFLFRDSLVLASGEVITARGPTTLVWERRGPEWRISFADADHYPFP